EEGDRVARHQPQVPAEREEGEVARVQHQLHAHEEDERVAPDEDRGEADGEERGGERQVVCERYAAHPQILALATTTAPTIATRRRMEVASKGRTNSVKISLPTAATPPK